MSERSFSFQLIFPQLAALYPYTHTLLAIHVGATCTFVDLLHLFRPLHPRRPGEQNTLSPCLLPPAQYPLLVTLYSQQKPNPILSPACWKAME